MAEIHSGIKTEFPSDGPSPIIEKVDKSTSPGDRAIEPSALNNIHDMGNIGQDSESVSEAQGGSKEREPKA